MKKLKLVLLPLAIVGASPTLFLTVSCGNHGPIDDSKVSKINIFDTLKKDNFNYVLGTFNTSFDLQNLSCKIENLSCEPATVAPKINVQMVIEDENTFGLELTVTNITNDVIMNFDISFFAKDANEQIIFQSKGYKFNVTKNLWDNHDEEACVIDNDGVKYFVNLEESKLSGGTFADPILIGEHKIKREKFNWNVLLNPKDGIVSTIPNKFLHDCESFNHEIIIPDGVSSIGNYFLHMCYSFDSRIILPNSIKTIGNGFMADCLAFSGQLFSLPSQLETIGDGFLRRCLKFNHDIIFPSTIKSINATFFMWRTNSMVSTINFQGLSTEIFVDKSISDNTLSVEIGSVSAKTGVIIKGTNAQQIVDKINWEGAFQPDEHSFTRKLIVSK